MATFRVSEMAPVDGYKLATGLVVPRPIGWIGSVSETGVFNLAPFSFFNAMGAAPPCVVVSPLTREGHPKDTLANLRHTGEFTHNVVTREVIEAVNMTAATLDHDVDEFAHAGLTAVPSDVIGCAAGRRSQGFLRVCGPRHHPGRKRSHECQSHHW